MTRPTLALVGLRGFAGVHLTSLRRRHDDGEIRLVGVVDPAGPVPEVPADVPWFASLGELLGTVVPQTTVVSTPIPTHLPLARQALLAGSDVYLEKPPVAGLDEYDDLREVARRTGRSVQVGFQNLGSPSVARVRELAASGAVGDVRQVDVLGPWSRRPSYYARAAWAGRRLLAGVRTADGVVTNPLAHGVNTALRLAGIERRDQVAAVHTELYRVHDIECDDTAYVRVEPVHGPAVAVALTLAAPEQVEPMVGVRGEAGSITLAYTVDRVELRRGDDVEVEQHPRTDLVAELVEHGRDPSVPLSSPLGASEAFMVVLEAVQRAPVHPVDQRYVQWGDGEDAAPVLADVVAWCRRALDEGGFLAAGAPWADPAAVTRWRPSRPLAVVELDGAVLAVQGDGGDVALVDGPRPFLHPVRTRSGVRVSDDHAPDHVWHHGISTALQHVGTGDGPTTSFWGGGTYGSEDGYQERDDHGRIEHRGFLEQGADSWVEELEWVGRDGRPLLRERRRVSWAAAGADAWVFGWHSTLTPLVERLELGSPGSHSRVGGGYGGLSWRLPTSVGVDVRTPTASGEDTVHGSTAPWLAWSASVPGGEVTVALAGADATTAADPWFVRVTGYPGIGSALAWDRAVVTTPADPVRRSFRGLVADGRLDDATVAALLAPPGTDQPPA